MSPDGWASCVQSADHEVEVVPDISVLPVVQPRPRRWPRKVYLCVCAVAVLCVVDAFLVEPNWVKVRDVRIGDHPTLTVVHISDLHHTRRRRAFLEKAVARINRMDADLVCFTGDLTETTHDLAATEADLADALEVLARINRPLFGVPGNHDFWSGPPLEKIRACFRATGGAWLADESTVALDGAVEITGLRGGGRASPPPQPATGPVTPARHRILLVHLPAVAQRVDDGPFDLILAGHSHGGQVRVPFWGALILPHGVGRWDRGLFQTPAGPLYVNPGLGTFFIGVRFLCRPEITVIRLGMSRVRAVSRSGHAAWERSVSTRVQ
ncbi:MAG: hypothetical protein A3K18_27005 [Lentisphaerae bacterium RIFOXYA12_64_32]|nr:MAG: hypothetical protein A3K18_27005 [Lentisphaerae bacterium RIFOXYA12_64_32]